MTVFLGFEEANRNPWWSSNNSSEKIRQKIQRLRSMARQRSDAARRKPEDSTDLSGLGNFF
jgi:hypothetical protein